VISADKNTGTEYMYAEFEKIQNQFAQAIQKLIMPDKPTSRSKMFFCLGLLKIFPETNTTSPAAEAGGATATTKPCDVKKLLSLAGFTEASKIYRDIVETANALQQHEADEGEDKRKEKCSKLRNTLMAIHNSIIEIDSIAIRQGQSHDKLYAQRINEQYEQISNRYEQYERIQQNKKRKLRGDLSPMLGKYSPDTLDRMIQYFGSTPDQVFLMPIIDEQIYDHSEWPIDSYCKLLLKIAVNCEQDRAKSEKEQQSGNMARRATLAVNELYKPAIKGTLLNMQDLIVFKCLNKKRQPTPDEAKIIKMATNLDVIADIELVASDSSEKGRRALENFMDLQEKRAVQTGANACLLTSIDDAIGLAEELNKWCNAAGFTSQIQRGDVSIRAEERGLEEKPETTRAREDLEREEQREAEDDAAKAADDAAKAAEKAAEKAAAKAAAAVAAAAAAEAAEAPAAASEAAEANAVAVAAEAKAAARASAEKAAAAAEMVAKAADIADDDAAGIAPEGAVARGNSRPEDSWDTAGQQKKYTQEERAANKLRDSMWALGKARTIDTLAEWHKKSIEEYNKKSTGIGGIHAEERKPQLDIIENFFDAYQKFQAWQDQNDTTGISDQTKTVGLYGDGMWEQLSAAWIKEKQRGDTVSKRSQARNTNTNDKHEQLHAAKSAWQAPSAMTKQAAHLQTCDAAQEIQQKINSIVDAISNAKRMQTPSPSSSDSTGCLSDDPTTGSGSDEARLRTFILPRGTQGVLQKPTRMTTPADYYYNTHMLTAGDDWLMIMRPKSTNEITLDSGETVAAISCWEFAMGYSIAFDAAGNQYSFDGQTQHWYLYSAAKEGNPRTLPPPSKSEFTLLVGGTECGVHLICDGSLKAVLDIQQLRPSEESRTVHVPATETDKPGIFTLEDGYKAAFHTGTNPEHPDYKSWIFAKESLIPQVEDEIAPTPAAAPGS
jgi:hypothetical protein